MVDPTDKQKEVEQRLEELAGAVASGENVEWKSVEAPADTEAELEVIRNLRSIERISELHRSGHAFPAREDAPQRDPAVAGGSWGHLELLGTMDTGAFGRIIRARDTRLDREVALKLFEPDEADSAGGESVLVEEARLLAKVRHENVLTVHGADRIDGQVGIWTELVQGRNLEDLVESTGPLGAGEAINIALPLCRALAAIHGAGLVHGDIKPRNVMREEGGRILLVDFGAGRELSGEDDPAARGVSGTPLFAAPEVLQGGVPTPQADLYGLGVLIYYLLTASYPVTATSLSELRQAHAEKERTPLRDRRPDLPDRLVLAVERALAWKPEDRFGSAGEMEARLHGVAAQGGRRKGWVLPVVGGLLLLGALWAAFLGGWGEPAPVSYTAEASMVRNADGVEEGLVDGDSLSVGDGLVLHFRASRELHVYVLNEDARGEAFVLFPLAGYDLRNPLSADVLHVLPGVRDGKRAEWVVTSAGERERFIVIASPGAVASLEEELGTLPVAGGLPGEATPEPTSGRRGTGGTRVVAEGPVRLAPGRLEALLGKLPLGSEPSGSDGLWVRTFEFRNPETP